ncbi:YybH family protein [Pareuzebyella sediminis]|uniref:YybH family protein n=1 Tax=Pareuzebyella sediminis TaxID=2607998 RepID=UPI0011EDCDC8|nr:nuclear transport factor 2 family protein [Pareuzebyella sediminis]
MKKLLLTSMILVCLCCNKSKKNEEHTGNTLDVKAELASIEETRTAFQLAIKENRFGDLMSYATQNVKSLTPECGAWEPFKKLRSNPSGLFSYDSLVMKPQETIIVSDSVAYDFGTSSTFYTDENGESVELTATFLAVLKKDKKDGIWKLHREVANTRALE